MKVLVLGATGMVGSAIVTEGRRRGQTVVTSSTRPGAADVVLDLLDTDALAQLAAGSDAVVISVPPPRDGSDHQPWIDAHRRLAERPFPARLAMVGGAGSSLVDGMPLLDSPDFPAIFRAEATSAATVLDLFRAAPEGADWVILSPPPQIGPGERTGGYRTGADDLVGPSISTEDYAVALWDELEEPQHRRTRFTVAS
ncbi:NAD(P)-dependent oxidoreductase [Pseudactinotalea suaedae]|uniref:NAD(P)-dependent oxidoreductase n=1 Tax=Pseudactinotalea suaedae TaxID=1524924 RepID=UPI0012E2D2D5|nr:NAD(P)H-binding protein [Pseudactinotalea suaedae]